MMLIQAMSLQDLIRAVDNKSESRSRRCSSNVEFVIEDGVFECSTQCAGSNRAWSQVIAILDWNILAPEEALEADSWDEVVDAYPEILVSDVGVACDCPAFLYWGSAYIVDQLDAGNRDLARFDRSRGPEGRFPSIRDPLLDRTLCKHLISAINEIV